MANKVVERHIAIVVNLRELDRVLLDAVDRSTQACELIQTGNADGAIGTLLDLEGALDDAKALFRGALALYRRTTR